MNVVQLETAVGAAIKSFDGAMGKYLIQVNPPIQHTVFKYSASLSHGVYVIRS